MAVVNLAELAARYPDWAHPQQYEPQPLPAKLRLTLIRKRGRPKTAEIVEAIRGVDPVPSVSRERRRRQQREWYHRHAPEVLARLKAKRMELAEKSRSV